MNNRERNLTVLILAALLFAFWCKGATTNYIKDVASGNNTGATGAGTQGLLDAAHLVNTHGWTVLCDNYP